MTATPNTTGPSAEIKRFDPVLADAPHDGCCAEMASHPDGRFVLHSDALAALSRAREEARREALQDAKFAAEATGRVVTDGLARLGRYEQGYARARADIEYAIHALLTPTPQGETKEQQP